MNNKKNFLFTLTLFLLSSPLPMIAMLSKPQSTAEEQKHTQAELENEKEQTALFVNECQKEDADLEKVSFFIQQGADVNAQDKTGFTPLHYACALHNFNLAKLLIENGANIEIKDFKGFTPLFYTCLNNDFNITKLLIENGANIEIKVQGLTPLHIVCQNGHLNIVKLLIEKDANVDVKTNYMVTPLHLACQYGKFDIASYSNEKSKFPLL